MKPRTRSIVDCDDRLVDDGHLALSVEQTRHVFGGLPPSRNVIGRNLADDLAPFGADVGREYGDAGGIGLLDRWAYSSRIAGAHDNRIDLLDNVVFDLRLVLGQVPVAGVHNEVEVVLCGRVAQRLLHVPVKNVLLCQERHPNRPLTGIAAAAGDQGGAQQNGCRRPRFHRFTLVCSRPPSECPKTTSRKKVTRACLRARSLTWCGIRVSAGKRSSDISYSIIDP